jgi:hypothetical protein
MHGREMEIVERTGDKHHDEKEARLGAVEGR